MASPDPLSLDRIHEIPDPARDPSGPPPAPPTEAALGHSATRAERRIQGRAAMLLAILWLAAATALFGVRPDIASPSAAAPIVAWLLAAGVILGVLLRPGARGLPAGVRAVQHALWIIPAAYVVGIALASSSSAADPPVTWASVRGCLGLSGAITLGPLAAAALFLRGSFLSAPGWRGAAVGAIVGLSGSIGVHAHCPVRGFGHLFTAHGAAIAIGAALGVALGRLGGRS